MFTNVTADPEPANASDFKIKGGGIAHQFLIGGTPTPGFVIGGGAMGVTIPNATREVDGEQVNVYGDDDVILSMLGVFVDVYPDPTSGLHFQGLVGYAQLSSSDSDAADNPTGIGLSAGVGYEWWVGEQWGIGLLGKLMYASTKDSANSLSGPVDLKYSTVAPALLFTATNH